jgi:predicted PurR-regulated permease PerM
VSNYLRSLPSSAFYLFLVSGDTFLRKLLLVTPSLKDKKRAVQIVRNIETDISFYLLMVASINIALGLIVIATAGLLGISDPFLWGTLANRRGKRDHLGGRG